MVICKHLKESKTNFSEKKFECEECVKENTHPVQLRQCLTCGHVGCCDSSEGMHATKHFQDTHHPVMQSFEKNQEWKWCYVDKEYIE